MTNDNSGRVCTVPDCGGKHKGRGYCGKHLQRARAGKPLDVDPPRDLAARLWAKVDRRGPDECWPWTAYRDKDGYGTIRPGGSAPTIAASRAAWIVTHGPIADGAFVLHHCDNPPCCNPAHLFLGTAADNAADRDAKGRTGTTKGIPRKPWGPDHPLRLHPERRCQGERKPNARWTDEQIRAMRAAYAGGESQGSIARRYGTLQSSVSGIVRRKSWAHVE